MRLGVGAALVGGEVVEGDVTIGDGAVAEVGVRPAGRGGTAVPGFVDLHINGVAGIDFLTTDVAGYRRAATALARAGVVAFQPTFVSSRVDAYTDPLAVAGEVAAAHAGLPLVTGVHLEGPFLSPLWPGAHDPIHLRTPDPGLAARLVNAGPVRTITLAPELPGGLDLTAQLAKAGLVVSCGHSDADAPTAHAAFDRGARAITHVHNAHRRWKPRDPGLGGVALVRPDVTVQAIVDGVHLAPESAYAAFLGTGPRFCLVTDAIEAAMRDARESELGGRLVQIRDGAVRLPDGTLAGSVLTMDEAVRNLVASGASLTDAVRAASAAPARLLGRDDLGALRRGAPAHLTVLDEELRVVRTLVGGVEAFGGGASVRQLQQ
ncbi:MAG TPA: N-acetylglucosamine-6-phosphate deacetylase [Thermoleophilaceae bacterium]|nr:N-acetylglucosamine-6-phosphate deacetylase [Thermoleophilaceae bacterium]